MSDPLDHEVPALSGLFRLQWEEAQGCHVLLYPEGMVRLSPSAGAVLTRVDGARDVAAIIADLETAYPGAALATDVRNFLTQAHEHGWIRF